MGEILGEILTIHLDDLSRLIKKNILRGGKLRGDTLIVILSKP
jgi:hypothetical protein